MKTRLTQWLACHKTHLFCACGIVCAYLLMFALGITCPIKFLTGISCPGCGLTRAWTRALMLDPLGALAYHPLFWLAPIAVFLFCFEKRSRACRIAFYTIVGVAFAIWGVRLFDLTDTVVVFEPQNGVFARLAQAISSLF